MVNLLGGGIMLPKVTVAVLAIAMAGTLATDASAKHRHRNLVFPFQGQSSPNAPTISQRMGNQQVDPTVSGTWTGLANAFPGTGGNGPATALLLTDGSVVMHDICTPNWYRLLPDNTGSYINGTWSGALAPMIGSGTAPDGYGPLYFASAVLPDGSIVVQGGEAENSANGNPIPGSNPPANVSNCPGTTNAADSTKGSLYNPVTNTWTAVTPPAGWNNIGDAAGVLVGPNNLTGGYAAAVWLLQDCCEGAQIATKTIPQLATAAPWTNVNKVESNNEEGWVLLPNGQVLTVDTHPATTTATELFDPSTGTWASAGNTPQPLTSTNPQGEMGPAVGIGFNMVVQFGGNSLTAVFSYKGKNPNPSTSSWTAGPSFPSPQEVADGPAALLPNGNILVQSSNGFVPGTTNGQPSLFWEFSTAGMTPANPGVGTLTPVNNPPCNDAKNTNVGSFQGRMLVLPSGGQQNDEAILWDAGLFSDNGNAVNCASVYRTNPGDGSPNNVMRPPPHVNTVSNTTLFRGNTYTLTGSMFRGVSQGAAYGDDAQSATNYPMVRITNNASKKVCWGRTHDWAILTSTQFDVPPATTPAVNWPLLENPCDPGASTLVVITNGLISNPIAVTIN
jgi:hypothetical protein